MASIRHLGGDRYRVIISNGYKPNGERDRRSKVIKAKTEEEAVKKANKMEAILELEKDRKCGDFTFKEAAEQWRKLIAPKRSEITVQKTDYILDTSLMKRFGRKKLKDIQVVDIANYLEELRNDGARMDGAVGGYSDQSVKHYYATLHKILQFALKHELCDRNPCDLVEKPKVNRKEKKAYNPEEVKAIVNALEKEFIFIIKNVQEIKVDGKIKRFKDGQSKRIKNAETLRNVMFLLLDISSGCRKGELLGLSWDRVNFDDNSIRIKNTVQNVTGKGLRVKENPKNEQSKRKIVIPEKTMEMLRQYKDIQDQLRCNYSEEFEDSNMVFTQKTGKPMSYNSINKWFNGFTDDYGFKRLSIHEIRHTHITNLIYKKVDIVSVSRRAGHSSPMVTLTEYAHFVEGADKESADTISTVMYG